MPVLKLTSARATDVVRLHENNEVQMQLKKQYMVTGYVPTYKTVKPFTFRAPIALFQIN